VRTTNNFWKRLRAHLHSHQTPSPNPTKLRRGGPRIFLVVEGANDIQFLRRISAILHIDDPRMPDLSAMERRGELIFVPFGGGDVSLWTNRLAGLSLAELHLYDGEMPPETESRQRIADAVNRRPRCQAFLTKKRSLENYLSPDAIREAGAVDVSFSDHDHVAELVARQMHTRLDGQPPWHDLPSRRRKRRRDRVKKWLNTRAVERMNPKRLAERDPDGEVCEWLAAISRLAGLS
jgi:putative ATP-dependent endonuclease of OLD family